MKTRILASTVLFTLVAFGILTAGDWTQWGGPAQDFQSDASDLAGEWPESGPKQLWSRELGSGYSGILIEDGRLSHRETVVENLARIRDVEIGPDGDVLLLLEHAAGGQIVRMSPTAK